MPKLTLRPWLVVANRPFASRTDGLVSRHFTQRGAQRFAHVCLHIAERRGSDLVFNAAHSGSREARGSTICCNDRFCERAKRAALPWPWSI